MRSAASSGSRSSWPGGSRDCARAPTAWPGRRAALAHRAGHVWEQGLLPLAFHGAPAVLSPANLAPLALGRRNVIVIHDAAALRHPEWYGRAYVAYQRALLPRLARSAGRVITVSEFSRAELIDVLGAPPERVVVVAERRRRAVRARRARAAAARAALGLPEPYVLAVGTRIARKNLAALENAAAHAARARRRARRGGIGPPLHARRGRLAGALARLRPRAAPARALRRARRRSSCRPCTRASGCRVIEAMASGTPVAAADRGALPEVAGGAALLFDPDDPGAAAGVLERLLGDPALAADLRERGRERAGEFSWERTAEATDAVVASLLAE